mgnify:CR=1 FL=1
MPEKAGQVEIENSHIQSQQLENTLVTAKFKKLNRTVVMEYPGLLVVPLVVGDLL